ncbi:MAG TPA: PfkB family carbohydrate kinase [Actinomycetes bacterium]|jgi:cytidyltransferase-like protein|nr:PfkB family carbohydrate kinase [Actinomycetes bacterium]
MTMTQSLPLLVGRCGELSALVLGESILDVYLRGRTTRVSREAPVPVVDLDGRVDRPGGAANAAVNLAGLGARVELLSVLGDDPAGARLRELLLAAGVGIDHLVVQPGRRTLIKRRLVRRRRAAPGGHGHAPPARPGRRAGGRGAGAPRAGPAHRLHQRLLRHPHHGHVAYLNRAKALGDVLVVGVNSDAGVRRLKGPDRPLNTLEDRIAVLGALSCIDHLVAFDDDTPADPCPHDASFVAEVPVTAVLAEALDLLQQELRQR